MKDLAAGEGSRFLTTTGRKDLWGIEIGILVGSAATSGEGGDSINRPRGKNKTVAPNAIIPAQANNLLGDTPIAEVQDPSLEEQETPNHLENRTPSPQAIRSKNARTPRLPTIIVAVLIAVVERQPKLRA